jgi:chemotaxis signal transduction protein
MKLTPSTAELPPRIAPEADSSEAPHLVFMVDSQPYACPIQQIERLIRLADARVRKSPEDAPAWEHGRFTLQNEAGEIPILSLRNFWGLPPLKDEAGEARQALLVSNLTGQPAGLLVDSCRCVLSNLPPKAYRYELPTALMAANGRALRLVTPWKESLLVVLELKELLPAKVEEEPRTGLTPELQ